MVLLQRSAPCLERSSWSKSACRESYRVGRMSTPPHHMLPVRAAQLLDRSSNPGHPPSRRSTSTTFLTNYTVPQQRTGPSTAEGLPMSFISSSMLHLFQLANSNDQLNLSIPLFGLLVAFRAASSVLLLLESSNTPVPTRSCLRPIMHDHAEEQRRPCDAVSRVHLESCPSVAYIARLAVRLCLSETPASHEQFP